MKKYIYFILMILWMATIFWFSSKNADVSGEQSQSLTEKILGILNISLSENSVNILENIIRKICHFSEYFILSAISLAFFESIFKSNKAVLITLGLCVLYAVTDEIHQYFVPGRACRLTDMIIDASGSFVYIGILKLFRRLKVLRNNKR